MFRSGAIVVGVAALMCSCANAKTEQLKVQLQEAHDREAAMTTELEGLRAEVRRDTGIADTFPYGSQLQAGLRTHPEVERQP